MSERDLKISKIQAKIPEIERQIPSKLGQIINLILAEEHKIHLFLHRDIIDLPILALFEHGGHIPQHRWISRHSSLGEAPAEIRETHRADFVVIAPLHQLEEDFWVLFFLELVFEGREELVDFVVGKHFVWG